MSGPRTAAAVAALVLGVTGCSRQQLDAWVGWYQADPQAAVDFAATPEVQDQLAPRAVTSNGHAARWEQIAWCESRQQWSLRAANRTGTYGGGLMIRDNVWRAYGGQQFAATADRASKAEQITVAERILADVGWSAWDCA